MDTSLDQSNCRSWWDLHQANCSLEWACTASWCVKATLHQLMLALMCSIHHKQRIEEFFEAQDNAEVASSFLRAKHVAG